MGYVESIKAIVRSGRGLQWEDRRDRSPKAMADFSGVLLSKITNQGVVKVQEFDYDTISQFHMCHDLVFTAIELVSTTTALGKLKVRTKGSKDALYLPDHPLQILLDGPDASMTQFDFLQSYVVHQLLFGNVTVLLLRQDMTKRCPVCEDGGEDCTHQLYFDSTSPIQQMVVVHPSNISIKYVKALKKRCFFYVPNPGVGPEYIIHPNNMLSDPIYNENEYWYGISPTSLLQRWLNLDSVMTQQISDYFANGSIPSMIVSLKPGSNFTYEDEPQTLVEKMKESWEKQFSSRGAKQKAPAFTYGDIDVQKVQERISDQAGKEIFNLIESRISATYGIPPTLFQVGMENVGQRASAEQGEKDFYNRTISKILTRIKNKINMLVVPSYGDDIEVVWDLTEMGIAAFLLKEKEAKIEKHWELGLLPRNKAQTMLGYDADTSELGNDYYRLTVMNDGGGTSTTNQLDKNLRVEGRNESNRQIETSD